MSSIYEDLGLKSENDMLRRIIWYLAKKNGGAIGVDFKNITNVPADAYLQSFVDLPNESVGFEMWPKPTGDPDAVVCINDDEFRLTMLAERAAQVKRSKK